LRRCGDRAIHEAVPRKPAAPRIAAVGAPSTRSIAAAELLAAIRADPADDGARQVYADVLSERGDPRGEFITMQLARDGRHPTKEEAERELRLLYKHRQAWLAELAAVVGELSRSSLWVGPERDRGRLRFERGFLAGCSIKGSRAKIEAIADHPDLATVENLDLLDHADTLLATAELPALDELQLYARYLPALRKRPVGKQVKTLSLWDRDRGPAFVTDVESCAKLPALRTLRIYPRADILDDATSAIVRAGLALRHIETLVVELSSGGGELTREGTEWSCKLLPNTPKRVADALRKLL
jgi:uncharacterized protein (TIGR02996 family)